MFYNFEERYIEEKFIFIGNATHRNSLYHGKNNHARKLKLLHTFCILCTRLVFHLLIL